MMMGMEGALPSWNQADHGGWSMLDGETEKVKVLLPHVRLCVVDRS